MGHTNNIHYQLITKHSTTKVKAKTLKQLKNLKGKELTEDKLLRLRLTQKALQWPFYFFFLFFLLYTFSGRTPESFLANVLTLVIEEACDQHLTHSLDALLFATLVAYNTSYAR